MTSVREANQKAFPQVKIRHLRDLPAPRWDVMLNAVGSRLAELCEAASRGDTDALEELDSSVSRACGLDQSEHETVRRALARLEEGDHAMTKEYRLSVDPRILELLGPSLYTNIYYVLAELIANAYDADAHNVYIIAKKDEIRVEDDGHGMSYDAGMSNAS